LDAAIALVDSFYYWMPAPANDADLYLLYSKTLLNCFPATAG